MAAMDPIHRRAPLAAGLDTAIVVLFVSIGKREHDQDTAISGLLNTVAPFLIALVVAWLVLRAWRNPDDWKIGCGLWAITLGVGMLLRNIVFDDGTAMSFVIVAAAFLGFFLVGWRLLLALIDQRRSTSDAG